MVKLNNVTVFIVIKLNKLIFFYVIIIIYLINAYSIMGWLTDEFNEKLNDWFIIIIISKLAKLISIIII